MDDSNTTKPNKAIVAIIVIVLLAGAGVGGYYLATNKNESSESTQDNSATNQNQTSTKSSNITKSTTSYKDGTYKASGSYTSPGGEEDLDVTLVLANGKVTSSTVTAGANDPTAEDYQARFIGGYKSLVVGKSVNDIQLDRVAGSSLTSIGFNSALEQIKQDAAA